MEMIISDYILFRTHSTLHLKRAGKNMKWNELKRQKLEQQNSCQWGRHAKLYSDLQAEKGEPLVALDSRERASWDINICV